MTYLSILDKNKWLQSFFGYNPIYQFDLYRFKSRDKEKNLQNQDTYVVGHMVSTITKKSEGEKGIKRLTNQGLHQSC